MSEKVTYTTLSGEVVDTGRTTGQVERKRRRWDPLQEGTLTVGRITIRRDSNGAPIIVEGRGGYRGLDLMIQMEAASGRRGCNRNAIRVRIVTEGRDEFVLESRGQLMRAASCYYDVAAFERHHGRKVTAEDVDGLRVAIRLTVETYEGRSRNGAVILSADPRSATYESYMKLATLAKPGLVLKEKIVDGVKVPSVVVAAVPGWRLYPGSPAYRLMSGRLAGKRKRGSGEGSKTIEEFQMVSQDKGPKDLKKGPAKQLVERTAVEPDRMLDRMAKNVVPGGELPKSKPIDVKTPEGRALMKHLKSGGQARNVVNMVDMVMEKRARELRMEIARCQQVSDSQRTKAALDARIHAELVDLRDQLEIRMEGIDGLEETQAYFELTGERDEEGQRHLQRIRNEIRILQGKIRAAEAIVGLRPSSVRKEA